MTCTERWKQNVPTVLASRVISPYLVEYIIYFLMHIWECRKNYLKMKCYGNSSWVGKERLQSYFQFEGQPRKRQPCTEVPLCLDSGDPQSDSSKQQFCPNVPALFLQGHNSTNRSVRKLDTSAI